VNDYIEKAQWNYLLDLMKTITVKCESDHDEEISVEVEITAYGRSIKKISEEEQTKIKNKYTTNRSGRD